MSRNIFHSSRISLPSSDAALMLCQWLSPTPNVCGSFTERMISFSDSVPKTSTIFANSASSMGSSCRWCTWIVCCVTLHRTTGFALRAG